MHGTLFARVVRACVSPASPLFAELPSFRSSHPRGGCRPFLLFLPSSLFLLFVFLVPAFAAGAAGPRAVLGRVRTAVRALCLKSFWVVEEPIEGRARCFAHTR